MPWATRAIEEEIFGRSAGFRLCKMHGSVNWWWIPSDHLATTVIRQELAGEWGKPGRSEAPPGMAPFVVPPLAAKSGYYELSAVRELWQSARESLAGASRIVLMGYSAPATDLAIAALLSHYLLPSVPVTVVDIASDSVVGRLRTLGFASVSSAPGTEPIRRFVEEYEQTVSRTVAADLISLFDAPGFDLNAAVIGRVCGDSPDLIRLATTIKVDDDVTTIEASDWAPAPGVVERAVHGWQLREEIQKAATANRRLVLRVAGQRERAVLNIAPYTYLTQWLAVEA